MKNLVAKFFITLILVSGLSTLTLANTSINRKSAGPETIVKYYTVEALDVDCIFVDLDAGDTVTIKVTGDGDTDLDLFVYNSSLELIVSDESTKNDGYVQFKAKTTGTYGIAVVNNGKVYNRYKIEGTID